MLVVELEGRDVLIVLRHTCSGCAYLPDLPFAVHAMAAAAHTTLTYVHTPLSHAVHTHTSAATVPTLACGPLTLCHILIGSGLTVMASNENRFFVS